MALSPYVMRKLLQWKSDPVAFVKECIGATPSSQQEEFLTSLASGKRISVRSGHGTGKDASAVWATLWFMGTRPMAKVPVTAPTSRQLQDVFWSELSKWHRQSLLADDFVLQSEKFFCKDAPKEWWARAISPRAKSTSDEQAETLAGLHADHMMIIVDEASGVPDPVFVPLEGAMTQPDNKVVLIGNMTKNKGYFFDTHFHTDIKKDWILLHWDSRESSNVDSSMPDYFARKYGVNSNVFRIRVMGEPPLGDEDVLIPLHWALQCVGNEVEIAGDEPIYLGVDVARYGSDASVILPRQGLIIHPWEEIHSMDTITLGGRIILAKDDIGADGIAIDTIGIGAGTFDWLMKHGHSPFDVNVSRESSDISKYDRLRDELWCNIRDKCQQGILSFPSVKRPEDVESLGNQLANELSTPRYTFNPHGGIKVESKKEMKLRGFDSPNVADALCITEYFHNIATKVFKSRAKVPFKRQRSLAPSRYSWMCS